MYLLHMLIGSLGHYHAIVCIKMSFGFGTKTTNLWLSRLKLGSECVLMMMVSNETETGVSHFKILFFVTHPSNWPRPYTLSLLKLRHRLPLALFIFSMPIGVANLPHIQMIKWNHSYGRDNDWSRTILWLDNTCIGSILICLFYFII